MAQLRKELREAREERDIFEAGRGFLRPGDPVGLYLFIEAEKVEDRNVTKTCEPPRCTPSCAATTRTWPTSGWRGSWPQSPGLAGRCQRRWKKTTIADPDAQAAVDLIKRHFGLGRWSAIGSTSAPITYLWTRDGRAYLTTVIDLASRRVVGWALAHHMEASLVCHAMSMAIAARRRGRQDGSSVPTADRSTQAPTALRTTSRQSSTKSRSNNTLAGTRHKSTCPSNRVNPKWRRWRHRPCHLGCRRALPGSRPARRTGVGTCGRMVSAASGPAGVDS